MVRAATPDWPGATREQIGHLRLAPNPCGGRLAGKGTLPLNCERKPNAEEWTFVMAENESDRRYHTVCVFPDAAWAKRGLAALEASSFDGADVSILARRSHEVDALAGETFGGDAPELDVAGLGPAIARGPLIATLQGTDDGLSRTGVAATIRRAGFQAHDGYIGETLAARGGILVGVESESRAADALALFHSYGGGNAAIGAWRGRV